MTHNPGSPDAIRHGCTCDQEKNHAGKGEPFESEYTAATAHRWYIAEKCPVHSVWVPRTPHH